MGPTLTIEIEEGLRDQDWFKDLIAYWQPRVCPCLVFLRLVCIEETNSDGESRYATTWTYQGGSCATIGFSPTFFDMAEAEQEVTLVHELLHVTLFPINAVCDPEPGKGNSRLAKLGRDAHEKVVETLSRALVSVAYGDV